MSALIPSSVNNLIFNFCFEHSVVSQKRNKHPVSNKHPSLRYQIKFISTLGAKSNQVVLQRENFLSMCCRKKSNSISHFLAMCSSIKYPYFPHRRDWSFLEGGGFYKAKKCKEMYEASLEFPEGWGGLRKKSLL